MTQSVVQFKFLSGHASLPYYGSEHAAGLDLCYAGPDPIVIYPGQRLLVPTGLAWAAPSDVYGRIAPRSGLAVNAGIDVMAGVIDPDYRGEIKVLLINLNGHVPDQTADGEPFPMPPPEDWVPAPHTILPGDRIAQLIIEKCARPVVSLVNTLDETARAEDGFGSTGR